MPNLFESIKSVAGPSEDINVFEGIESAQANVFEGIDIPTEDNIFKGIQSAPTQDDDVIRAAPEPTFIDKLKGGMRHLFGTPPNELIAKAQASYAISKVTGVPQKEVINNMPAFTKALGMRSTPTTEELIGTMVLFPVMAGLASNPLATVAGIGGFMALDEVENFIVSTIQKEPYRFQGSRGLKEFLPQDTAQEWRDLADVADMIAKGAILRGAYKKAPAVKERLLRTSVEKFKLPETVFIEPAKVKSIFRTGEKISPTELDLIKGLNLTSKQYRAAAQEGIAIKVPAERIVHIADKPYWAKIKAAFGVEPFVKTKTFLAGKPKTEIAGFLPEPSPAKAAARTAPELKDVKLPVTDLQNQAKVPIGETIRIVQESAKLFFAVDKQGNKVGAEKFESDTLVRRAFAGKFKIEDKVFTPEEISTPQQIQLKKENLVDTLKASITNQAGFVNVGALAEPLQEALPTLSKIADEFTRYRGLTSDVVEKFVAAEEAVPQIIRDSVEQSNALLGHLDPVTRKQLQYALEERTPVPKGTEELARQVRSIEEWALAERQKRGYFKKDLWPNNAIDALTQEMGKLNVKIRKLEATDVKTFGALKKDVFNTLDLKESRDQILKRIDKLNRLKYTHRVTEPLKVAAKVRGKVARTITKFPYNFVGRKFDTIREAEEAGHTVGDLMESVAETIADTRVEALKDELIKAINNNPNFSSKTFKADWVTVDSRLMPAAKDHFYHPVMGRAIKELAYAGDTAFLVRAYDQINTFGKMIGFYNPLIMAKNDIAQGWRAAGIKFFVNIPKATQMHQNRHPQIAILERRGVYNNMLDRKPAIKEMIRILIDQASKTLPKRAFEQFMKALNPTQLLSNLMSVNNKTTWAMDRVLRTACWLGIQDSPVTMNLSEFEIADKANDFMANYAKFPRRSRRIANRVIFTPTYRVSMGRVFGEMLRHPVQHREQLLRHYMYRMFFRFVLPWLASMYVMNRYGKQVETFMEGHRLVIKDEKGEKVVAFSDPLLEQVKLTDRPLRTTLKFNLAFVPQFMLTWLNRGKNDYPKSDLEQVSEFFNIGAPGLRDYLNWRDQDKSTFEKWSTQLGIAYVYSREPSRHVEIERAVWYKVLDGLDFMPKWFQDDGSRERVNIAQAYAYYQSKLRKYEREFARTGDPETLKKIDLLEQEVITRYGVPVTRKSFEETLQLRTEISQRDAMTKEEFKLFKSPTWVKDVIRLRLEQGEPVGQ